MIGKVAGIADCTIVTKVVAGEMIPVDVARKSMPAKSVSGEAMRAESATHVDRTVGGKAMEAASVKAAKRRMEAAAHMKTTAAWMKAAATAAKVKAAFGHCRDVRREAERTHRNAGRKNCYRSLHGRFSIIAGVSQSSRLQRNARQALVQSSIDINCLPLRVSRWRKESSGLIFSNRCAAKSHRPQLAPQQPRQRYFDRKDCERDRLRGNKIALEMFAA